MHTNLAGAVDAYIDQHRLYRTEGRRGVENLCQLVRAIGYMDPYGFGQLSRNAAIGDLIAFLEDNSGCIEVIKDWIRNSNAQEFLDSIKQELDSNVEDDNEEY